MFSDVVCPWCYIAVTRLERAAAAHTLRTGEPVEIALRAYQLDPEAPSSSVPLLDALEAQLGDRERAEQSTTQVVEAGRPDGLDFDFVNAVQANSFDAHRMLVWAEASGGAAAQRDLAHELWRAHFAEGADIADHDTLAARAAAVGLDAEAADAWLASGDGADDVRLQVDTAASAGVTTAPTVIIGSQYAVRGSQPQDTYALVLREASDRLDAG